MQPTMQFCKNMEESIINLLCDHTVVKPLWKQIPTFIPKHYIFDNKNIFLTLRKIKMLQTGVLFKKCILCMKIRKCYETLTLLWIHSKKGLAGQILISTIQISMKL